MKLIAKAVAVVLCLYTTMQVACWQTVHVARSPHQKHEVRVKAWCVAPDCGIKIDVTSRFPPLTLDQLSDASALFAHIAWSQDSQTVAVLVVNGYGRNIETAYDLRRGQPVAFESARGLLSSSILDTYQPGSELLQPYGGDAIEWAIRDEAAHRLYRSKDHKGAPPRT